MLCEIIRSGDYKQLSNIKFTTTDVNYRKLFNGQTPLMYCSDVKCAEVLLKAGAGRFLHC